MNYPWRQCRWMLCVAVVTVLVLIVLNLAIPTVWLSPEIRARVVTPDGRPVSGAIVVANWNITESVTGGSLGQLALIEVVTNKNGWFRIPGWGPRFTWRGKLRESEPSIIVFHPDFVPLVINNAEHFVPRDSANSVIRFHRQGQTLILNPFHGSLIQYEHDLIALNQSLDIIFFSENTSQKCVWKSIPKLLDEMQKIKNALQRKGIKESINALEAFIARGPQQCNVAE